MGPDASREAGTRVRRGLAELRRSFCVGAPQRLFQLVGEAVADPRPYIIIKGARFDRARDSLVAEEAEEPRRQRDEVRLDESQIRVFRGEERVHEERGLVVEDLVASFRRTVQARAAASRSYDLAAPTSSARRADRGP